MTETSTAEKTAWWVAGALALVGIAALVLLTVALVRDGGISRIPPPLVSSQPTLAPAPAPEPVPAPAPALGPAPAPAPATPPR